MLAKGLALHLLPSAEIYYNSKAVFWPILPFLFLMVAIIMWFIESPLMAISLAIFSGGWVANCSDRVLFGPVADYIPAPLLPNIVFNLADFELVIGACLMVAAFFSANARDQIGNRVVGKYRFMGSKHSYKLLFIATVAAVFCLDWTSKSLAPQLLGEGAIIHNTKQPFLLAIIPITLGVVFLMHKCSQRWMAITLGLLAGGCLANLTDRMLRGPVSDFIPLPWPGPAHLQANLADLAIVFGGLALIILAWRQPKPVQGVEPVTPAR